MVRPIKGHEVIDLIAPHLMNGADGRKHIEIAGWEFRKLVRREESDIGPG